MRIVEERRDNRGVREKKEGRSDDLPILTDAIHCRFLRQVVNKTGMLFLHGRVRKGTGSYAVEADAMRPVVNG